jgi:DNA polymerase-3 subunit gamma/tau
VSHLAYARKYRPKDFDEIIDQEHIATTLKNAIEQDNLAHAYLFSGPRGIGKTSTARILAKALNCKKGPTAKPCNKCSSCEEIAQGRSMDVLEIDGASNRGIDEIRTLRENVKFAPTSSRFKIYIIDEVHMLTTEAFNALLKTLEEPPDHVKFIFATTEPHKVLPTILSRCQRFDFKKITTAGIIAKLKTLIHKEKIECQEEALYAIAKSADGSLRDAEVILDQLNSFSQGKITLDSVDSVLGLVSKQAVFQIVDQLDSEHIADNVRLIDELIRSGKDSGQLVSSFVDHFRDMMLLKCNSENLITLPKEDMQKLKKQGGKFELDSILYCITVLMKTQQRMKQQGMNRLLLEMAMIKMSKQDNILPASELMKQVQELQSQFNSQSPKVVKGFAYTPDHQQGYKTRSLKSSQINNIPPQNIAEPPLIEPQQYGQSGDSFDEDDSGLSIDVVNKVWPHIIRSVRKQKISLGTYLAEGRPIEVEKNRVKVGFPDECEFHRENLVEAQNLKIIEGAASQLLNKNIRLDMIKCERLPQELINDEPEPEESFGIADPDSQEETDMDDFIQSAIDVFKGRIVNPD